MLTASSRVIDRQTWVRTLVEGQEELAISGAVCASNLDGLVDEVERLAQENDRCVCADLTAVDFIDTPAIRILAHAACSLRRRRKRFRLVNLSPPLTAKLDRLHLLDVFCSEAKCLQDCDQSARARSESGLEVDVFSLPMELSYAREARLRVDTIAARLGYCKSDRSDISLAIGEATTNAIKYGKDFTSSDAFTVSCVADEEKLCVSVSDNGPGFCLELVPDCEDYLMVDHGRGIFFMRSVMDSVDYDFDRGTTVRMTKLTTARE